MQSLYSTSLYSTVDLILHIKLQKPIDRQDKMHERSIVSFQTQPSSKRHNREPLADLTKFCFNTPLLFYFLQPMHLTPPIKIISVPIPSADTLKISGWLGIDSQLCIMISYRAWKVKNLVKELEFCYLLSYC